MENASASAGITGTPGSIESSVLRAVGSWVSPGGSRGRLSILIYHRVMAAVDPLRPDEVDARRFEAHLAALADHFNVLPLGEAIGRLQSNSLPPRAACITFDDGYADNADVALPRLKRFGFNATFFIATGYLDGGCMWNDALIEMIRAVPGPWLDLSRFGLDRHRVDSVDDRLRTAFSLIGALKYLTPEVRQHRVAQLLDATSVKQPGDLMMTSAQVRALGQAGMTVGGHTVTHPILNVLKESCARKEIAEGREALQHLTGQRIDLFAYPNGVPRRDYQAVHVKMVKDIGFRSAVSTAWGTARAGSDSYQLPRFTPWDRSPRRFVLRLLNNCRNGPADQV